MAGAAEFGVESSEPDFVWPTALARKQKVVELLVKGLSSTLKTRGVEIIEGHGRITAPGSVVIEAPDESTSQITASSIIIATGSEPSSIPGYTVDGATKKCCHYRGWGHRL